MENPTNPMTITSPRPPAAQAVKDAALAIYDERVRDMAWPLDMPVVVAALRAVADQVVPDQRGDGVYLTGTDYHRWHERKLIRRQLLTIAAELDPPKPHPGAPLTRL